MDGGRDSDEYVSTACRLGSHFECQLRPIVRCVCSCHGRDNDEPGASPPPDEVERFVI